MVGGGSNGRLFSDGARRARLAASMAAQARRITSASGRRPGPAPSPAGEARVERGPPVGHGGLGRLDGEGLHIKQQGALNGLMGFEHAPQIAGADAVPLARHLNVALVGRSYRRP
jgi:hypothetical protein